MIALGAHALSIPLIQGGMGIGVSLGNLAGHVAACGGMGVISTAHPGYDRPDFEKDPYGANLRALKEHIEKAKAIAKGKGMVAVNAMVATSQYADSVRAAVAAGKHRHDVGNHDLLIIQLLLRETGIVDVLHLDAHALVQSGQNVALYDAGTALGVGIFIAVKRHVHSSLG